jgi:glycosyltransferase involved in cell wall biosynthesis
MGSAIQCIVGARFNDDPVTYRMRILHVIDSLDPKLGGPPMIAYRLASAQALGGHDVVLASYEAPEAADRIKKVYAKVPRSSQFRTQTFPRGGRMERLLARGARKHLAALVADADVVHLHSIWEPVLVQAASESHRQGKPYVVLLNGMLDPWSLSQRATKKKIALALVHKRMLKRAAALHLGNADEQRLIAPLKLPPPGVIIPNGVFFEELEPLPSPGTFRRQHPELGDAPYVLFLSRLHYKKGLDVLADAFAQVAKSHAGVRLVVAGPDDGAEADFRARIARSGLIDRVHVVGPLYDESKFAAMVDAACFCLPSRQEGFSVAVLESLACGTPAVITTECHFNELEPAGGGRVVPVDASAVASALLGMIGDPAARESMSRSARRLIREHYTWQHLADLAVDAYRHCLNGAR